MVGFKGRRNDAVVARWELEPTTDLTGVGEGWGASRGGVVQEEIFLQPSGGIKVGISLAKEGQRIGHSPMCLSLELINIRVVSWDLGMSICKLEMLGVEE